VNGVEVREPVAVPHPVSAETTKSAINRLRQRISFLRSLVPATASSWIISFSPPSRCIDPKVRFAIDSALEGDGFELSVPRRERSESLSGTGSVMEATKVRLMYQVTGLVRWEEAPGSIPAGVTDLIGPAADAHSGLVFLRIEYSDGDHGVLVVSCHLAVGTPNMVFEGITASKSFVDYWDRVAPVPNVDGNRTVFHTVR
jgi:hypothetical protein